jgi:hypothetical protein
VSAAGAVQANAARRKMGRAFRMAGLLYTTG